MEWEREATIDSIEQQLVSDERTIARLRARQLECLERLDEAQTATADGCRNLSEWTGQRLDIGVDSARRLVRTMRRTEGQPFLRKALAEGLVSFDRAEALSRRRTPVESEPDLAQHLDITGVRRLAADQVQIGAEDEARTATDQHLVMQPSLDRSWWRLWGGVDGPVGSVIDQTLTEKADQLPDLPDGTRGSAAWRRAMALYELASGGESPRAQITVFVDAREAVATDGRAGVRLQAGPRVGAQALQSILCDSIAEVTVDNEDGVSMRYGRRTRVVPPALRRATLATTGGHCAIDGCTSRYRVEAHHIRPYSEGGLTDPENLLPVCWFHHHIVIHERGFQLYRDPEHGRWRLRRPRSEPKPKR